MKIDDMGFSVRVRNILRRAGIETTEQLQELNIDDLMRIRGLGEKCVEEIRGKMKLADRAVTREMLQAAPSDGTYLHGFREGAEAMRSALIRELTRRARRTKGTIKAGLQAAADIAEDVEVTG